MQTGESFCYMLEMNKGYSQTFVVEICIYNNDGGIGEGFF